MKKARGEIPSGLLLSLDPGDTTGWALFKDAELIRVGQFRVTSLAQFTRLLQKLHPDAVVVENYRVYAHKLKQHVGSQVPTIRYIGAIQLSAELLGIRLYYQWAFQGKGFAKDSMLQQWGIWQLNKRHANDAIRHAAYWYVFNRAKK